MRTRPTELPRTLLFVALGIGCCSQRTGAPSRPASTAGGNGSVTRVALPGGERGIGFDDMRFDPAAGAVLVPGGMTGRVFALAAATRAVEAFDGFAHGSATSGHGDGATSVDLAPGLLLVADRTSRTVDVVDRASRTVAAHAALAAPPDYVRFVASTHEVWVTEPRARQIEVFDLGPYLAQRGSPVHTTVIPVPGGPESLEIDEGRGLAFTHVWTGARTLAIDLASHAVRSNWPSGCTHDDTQGLALDRARGWLFVACGEGAVTALDVDHGGRLLGRAEVGGEVDIIAYSPGLHHVYAPSERDGKLYVVGVGPAGALTRLGAVDVAVGAHCAASDGAATAFVCDPRHGAVAVLPDPFPGS